MTLDTSKNTADLFRDLNALRKANGMLPLKAWKDSRSKLEAAIVKLGALEGTIVGKTNGGHPVMLLRDAPRKNAMKDVGTPPIVPRKAKAQQPPTTTFTAFLLSRSINPKVARAKLRRAGMKGPYTLNDAVKKIVAP